MATKPKTTTQPTAEETQVTPVVEETVGETVGTQPEETPQEPPKDEKPVEEKPVELSDMVKQKIEFYNGYGGMLKPIIVAHGIFEYAPFDYSRPAKEQVLEQVEKYKSDVYLDEKPLLAQIKRMHNLYYGSTADTVPEEYINVQLNGFYELIYGRMFNGMFMTIDVYDNVLTYDIKYNFNFV